MHREPCQAECHAVHIDCADCGSQIDAKLLGHAAYLICVTIGKPLFAKTLFQVSSPASLIAGAVWAFKSADAMHAAIRPFTFVCGPRGPPVSAQAILLALLQSKQLACKSSLLEFV